MDTQVRSVHRADAILHAIPYGVRHAADSTSDQRGRVADRLRIAAGFGRRCAAERAGHRHVQLRANALAARATWRHQRHDHGGWRRPIHAATGHGPQRLHRLLRRRPHAADLPRHCVVRHRARPAAPVHEELRSRQVRGLRAVSIAASVGGCRMFSSANVAACAIAVAHDEVNRDVERLQRVQAFTPHRSREHITTAHHRVEPKSRDLLQHRFERRQIAMNVVERGDAHGQKANPMLTRAVGITIASNGWRYVSRPRKRLTPAPSTVTKRRFGPSSH